MASPSRRNQRPVTTALAVIVAVITDCGAPQDQASRDPAWSFAADAFIAPYVSSGNMSGAVLVRRGGGTVYERLVGRSDPERGGTVHPATRFRIGSVTKSFTAAAVLRLRDRGAFALDDPVERLIPGFPHGDAVTVRHLLSHRSGLGNYYFLPDFAAFSARRYERPADVVRSMRTVPLQFRPGARRAYNNINYTALAWLVERVSGVRFADYLRRELLSPLGLDHTGDPPSDVPGGGDDLAGGQEPVGIDSTTRARSTEYSFLVGAGSLAASAGDVARWLEAVDAGRVVSGQSRDELIEFAALDDEFLGRPALSTAGWDGMGYSAFALRVPTDSLTVVVLSNVSIAAVPGEIARGVAALALDSQPVSAPLAPRALPADSLSLLEGEYRFGNDFYVPSGRLVLVARNGWLLDTGRTPEAALIPLADGEFLYRPTWARVRFLTREPGVVEGLRFDGRFVAERMTDETALQ